MLGGTGSKVCGQPSADLPNLLVLWGEVEIHQCPPFYAPCHFWCDGGLTFQVSGYRGAKRRGNPTAKLLGGPLHLGVRQQCTARCRTTEQQRRLTRWRTSIRDGRLAPRGRSEKHI